MGRVLTVEVTGCDGTKEGCSWDWHEGYGAGERECINDGRRGWDKSITLTLASRQNNRNMHVVCVCVCNHMDIIKHCSLWIRNNDWLHWIEVNDCGLSAISNLLFKLVWAASSLHDSFVENPFSIKDSWNTNGSHLPISFTLFKSSSIMFWRWSGCFSNHLFMHSIEIAIWWKFENYPADKIRIFINVLLYHMLLKSGR